MALRRLHISKPAFGLSIITASFSAHAQGVVAQAMPPVVVTATRIEQPITDAIPHTTVISAKEIRDSQAIDLPTLLRREAGIEITQNGGIGATSSIFMRGANSNQTLILIDGIRVGSATTGQTPIESIMLDQVERVEIVRGNVSSLYGSSAVGGVIQIFTKRGRGEPRPDAKVTLGSRGTQEYAAGYGGEVGNARFNINASHTRTDGFSAIDTTLAPNASPDPDGYKNLSFSGQFAYKLAPGQELGFNGYRTDGVVDFDSAFGPPTATNQLRNVTSLISAFSNNRINSWWSSKLSIGQGVDESKNYTNGVFFSRFQTTNNQYTWQNEFTIAPEHTIAATLERLEQRVTGTTAYTRDSRDVNSGQLGYNGRFFGRHSLQGSVRRDDFSDFGGQNSWLAGYGFDITPAWKATAMQSTAFNAPTFNQLFFPGFGNPNLQPERARSTELGLQYSGDIGVARLIWFRTRYEDLIVNVTSQSTGLLVPTNVARARVEGWELSYAGQIAGWDLRAALTLQDPVNETTGQQLQRRATAYGSLSVARTVGQWRFGGDLTAADQRPDLTIVGSRPTELAGYTVLNLVARYNVTKSLSLAARLENAFDRDYQLAHGYNTRPRGVFFTVAWQP